MRRLQIPMLLVLVALAGSPARTHAQPDPLADYGGAPVYATYRALYRAHWCLTNPARYAEVATKHPVAAPLLRSFIRDRMTLHLNDSLAFLAIDVHKKRAIFMKVDASTGRPDETTWNDKTSAVAILLDTFLDEQRANEGERVAIAIGQRTMEDAIKIWSKQQADPWTSAEELADLTAAIKSYARTAKGQASLGTLKAEDRSMFDATQKLIRLDPTALDRIRNGKASAELTDRFTTPGRGYGLDGV